MSNLDTIDCCDINAKDFFTNYINKRRPCHFCNHFKVGWGLNKWTNEYLKSTCDSEVKVEYRNSPSERFGKGNEIQMPFSKFIDEIDSGSELYYMTTQKLNYSAEGQASILSPPICKLTADFPINPPLMGNLIVQNINMWMGASSKRVSSGLHHDYHDNLYIVLRGTKHISLFPPTEHGNMYTVGKLEKLHPNGRINYEGCVTKADGSHESAEKALQASLDLEKAMLLAEVDGESHDSDIEDALENLLDAQIAYEKDCSDINDDDDEDEDEEVEEQYDEVDDDIPLDLTIPKEVLNVGMKRKERPVTDSDDEGIENDDLSVIIKKHKEMARENSKEYSESTDNETPPNFSRVDTTLPPKELKNKFPLFDEAKERGAEITVILNAGEMLYLPAGWFHEVQSVGAPPLGHIAMNYWFHPPDNNQFSKPYCSDFWKKDWEIREKAGNI